MMVVRQQCLYDLLPFKCRLKLIQYQLRLVNWRHAYSMDVSVPEYVTFTRYYRSTKLAVLKSTLSKLNKTT